MVATFFFYSYPKLQEPHFNIPLKMVEVWSFNWQRNNCQKYSTPFRPHLLVTIYVRNGLLLCHFNLAIIHEVSLLGYSASKLSTNLHSWVSHIIPLAFLILLPVHHLWHSPVQPISPSSPVWWSLKLVVCWQWRYILTCSGHGGSSRGSSQNLCLVHSSRSQHRTETNRHAPNVGQRS